MQNNHSKMFISPWQISIWILLKEAAHKSDNSSVGNEGKQALCYSRRSAVGLYSLSFDQGEYFRPNACTLPASFTSQRSTVEFMNSPPPVQCLHPKSVSQRSFIHLLWSEGRISLSFYADTHTHTLRVSTPLCLFPPHSLASCLWLYSSSQSWTSVFHGEVCQDVRLDICAKCLYWLWQSAGIPIVIVMESTSRGQTHYVTNYCWLFYGLGL